MNYNEYYQNYKFLKSVNDFVICKPRHPRPQNELLECGEGTGSRTFTSSDDAPFQLAHVTVDTTCLSKPEVLIKFSSIVNVEIIVSPATLRLQYELFRVCDEEEPTSLGIWMFEEVNAVTFRALVEEEAFNFIFCECTNCPRCCEYFVTVKPVEITGVTATVSNGRVAALSGSQCNCLKHEDKIDDLKYDNNGCKQKHPKPKEIILSCGQGIESIDFRHSEPQPPAKVAHVDIDTTCLNSPKVLIEFSSIILLELVTDMNQLQFELFRVCGDSNQPLLRGVWTFIITQQDFVSNSFQKAFSFIFCDCNVPSKCCEYFVRVTPVEIVNDIQDGISLQNVRMAALAQSCRNSLYYYYNDCKILNVKSHCIDCVSKRAKPKKIILECGEGTGSKTFTSSSDPAFQLAHVSIDTTCLYNPIVNIEFSSTVSFNIMDFFSVDLQLRYELFKKCDNDPPISLGIWSVDRIGDFFFAKSTNTIDFTFCECVSCSGRCEYFVTVTPVTVSEGTVTATVSNGRIAALAGER